MDKWTNKARRMGARAAGAVGLALFLVLTGAALAQTQAPNPGASATGLSTTGVSTTGTPAAKPSAIGRWQTIDDTTGKPRAIVRIYEVNGAYQGEIEQVFYAPDEKKNGICEKCPEPQRGKRVVGMTILWALQPDGSGRGYTGGRILDPANATVYKCKIWLDESGQSLDVRGFVGLTGLLGRTQRWHRVA